MRITGQHAVKIEPSNVLHESDKMCLYFGNYRLVTTTIATAAETSCC